METRAAARWGHVPPLSKPGRACWNDAGSEVSKETIPSKAARERIVKSFFYISYQSQIACSSSRLQLPLSSHSLFVSSFSTLTVRKNSTLILFPTSSSSNRSYSLSLSPPTYSPAAHQRLSTSTSSVFHHLLYCLTNDSAAPNNNNQHTYSLRTETLSSSTRKSPALFSSDRFSSTGNPRALSIAGRY